MSKDHLKRLAAPKTWGVTRKDARFITKPAPGPHSMESGMPISVLLKTVLGYAGTTSEARKILNAGQVKVDGKARKDFKFPVGIFDTIEFTSIGEYFRVMLNRKGKIGLVKISKEESQFKPCKIIGKKAVKGKVQLNLYDGKNILADPADGSSYNVGDTILLTLPEQKISKHLKLDKKSAIFLIGGKHIGESGNVENINKDKIVYKDENGSLIETSKKYAFVVA